LGVDISGTHWIAGGGGGAANAGRPGGTGGNGGGGVGEVADGGTGSAGTANTGGGGGGRGGSNGGRSGGSGVVIISYVTADFGSISITGATNTQTVSGSNTICVFKESGNFVVALSSTATGTTRLLTGVGR